LLDEHIHKIINTYSNRLEEDKYSRIAPLDFMASQEYNLNITRYVDTFEAEDSIDINAIAYEIKVLDIQIEETDKAIAIFVPI
jgi:type I restriction enzyme M protein